MTTPVWLSCSHPTGGLFFVMIPEKVLVALNEQLNFEFHSAFHYLAMETYFHEVNLHGFAHYMREQYKEERHARAQDRGLYPMRGTAGFCSSRSPNPLLSGHPLWRFLKMHIGKSRNPVG